VPKLSHPNGGRGGFTRKKGGESLFLFNICTGLKNTAISYYVAVMRD